MAKYSHSQIQMYLSCPLKFCYEKIEKIRPDIPNESLTLVLGTATHKALEELYKKVPIVKSSQNYKIISKDIWELRAKCIGIQSCFGILPKQSLVSFYRPHKQHFFNAY